MGTVVKITVKEENNRPDLGQRAAFRLELLALKVLNPEPYGNKICLLDYYVHYEF